MFNFRIVPSVLFASVLVSSVGLTANAQKAPSITDKGSIEGFFYDIRNNLAFIGRELDGYYGTINEDKEHKFPNLRSYDAIEFTEEKLSVKYSNPEGFKGVFSWEGDSGKITADVSIDVEFGTRLENGEIGASVKGYIGKDRNIMLGGIAFGDLLFGVDNFGHIEFDGHWFPSVSKKVHERFTLGKFQFSNGGYHAYYDPSEDSNILTDKLLSFRFSQDSVNNTDYPTYTEGWIATLISKNNTFNSDNALLGTFVAKAETAPIVEGV